VGGTQSISPEVAWFAGSGGFSNYFSQPHYQKSAVSNYLKNEISPATLAYYTPFFNSSGRAFPDVSAHSLTPEYVHPPPPYLIYPTKQTRHTNMNRATPST